MKDYTISELIALGKSGERFLEHKCGYTTTSFWDVTLNSSGHYVLHFSLQDDFQSGLSYDKKFKCGTVVCIELENFWTTLQSWPNREQRELEIMARKLASLDANLDQIQSAQVLAFVARLQPQIDEIRRMITHQPEEIDGETTTVTWPAKGTHPLDSADDDEVPF